MKPDLKGMEKLLAGVKPVRLESILARVVPLKDLDSVAPRDWLYLSGRKYRYNQAGASCIYFSESQTVAQMEYDDYWKGTPGEHQPASTYHAEVSLSRVIDLTDPKTLKALKIHREELFENWRLAKLPTLTQLLGTAALNGGNFAAIRYPSAAAERLGAAGSNVVIFRDRIRRPDSVVILGGKGKILQRWP